MEHGEHLTVTRAEYLKGYVLQIWFSNDEVRVFDFSQELDKGICRKPKNLNYFKAFTIAPIAIDWNNETGFAPEYLYERGKVM